MSTDLILSRSANYDAVMTIDAAVERRAMMVEFTSRVMNEGTDYGVIPGTQKPTLLKPGAEKLCTLFGLVPRFEIVREVEDWTGERTGGEPLFYYLYRCSLYRNEQLIAQGDGSCNSREKKYRFRNAERACPDCGKPVRKSKTKPEWYCWEKQGGCGATFHIDSPAIIDQPVGQIPNPDIFDLLNTLQKMATKRALLAAVLIGVNASEFYTQDIEDLDLPGVGTVNRQTGEVTEERPAVRQTTAAASQPKQNRTAASPTNAGNGTCPECHAPTGRPHATRCSLVQEAPAPSQEPAAPVEAEQEDGPAMDPFAETATDAQLNALSELCRKIQRDVAPYVHEQLGITTEQMTSDQADALIRKLDAPQRTAA